MVFTLFSHYVFIVFTLCSNFLEMSNFLTLNTEMMLQPYTQQLKFIFKLTIKLLVNGSGSRALGPGPGPIGPGSWAHWTHWARVLGPLGLGHDNEGIKQVLFRNSKRTSKSRNLVIVISRISMHVMYYIYIIYLSLYIYIYIYMYIHP